MRNLFKKKQKVGKLGINVDHLDQTRFMAFDLQGLKPEDIELLCKSRKVFDLLSIMHRKIEEKKNKTISRRPANPDINNIQEKLDRTAEIALDSVFYTLKHLPDLAEQVRKLGKLDNAEKDR